MVVSERGRTRYIQAFPISIDYRSFADQSASEPVPGTGEADPSQNTWHSTTVGVDRLDYTKGIPERIKVDGNFLRRYPEFHRRFS